MAYDGHIKLGRFGNKMLVSNNETTIVLEQPFYYTLYNMLLCATVVRCNGEGETL